LETTSIAEIFTAIFSGHGGGYYQHFHSINPAFFGRRRLTVVAQRPIWGSWASGFIAFVR
jgi:hypothetical protein